jgi:hypothetical protein
MASGTPNITNIMGLLVKEKKNYAKGAACAAPFS